MRGLNSSPGEATTRTPPSGARLRRLAGAALLSLVALAGCTTADNSAGPPLTAPLPPTAPRVVGITSAAAKQHADLIKAFGGEYRAPAAEKLLNSIVARLVKATDRPTEGYVVTILNSPAVNAFALPSGNLYVTRGLLVLANDTAEIAGVLAHEIAHVTARHAMERLEREKESDLVSRVASQVLNNPTQAALVQVQSKLSLASFSRQQELEADQIGVRTIARAGFDPYGATRFLVSLGRNASLRATGGQRTSQMDFLATHPSTPERVSRTLLAARQFSAPGLGEHDRDGYFAVIDGMAYGENPGDGFIRGRRFLHAGLGIAFTAPEGVRLENNGQAIIGLDGNGTQVFRFDQIEAPTGQSLEQHLRTDVAGDARTEAVESLTIAGFPAVTGLIRDNDFTFRAGLIQSGGALYRFLFAAPTIKPEMDRAYLQSIQSFRRLEGDEARLARPSRIAVVTASSGDTQEAFAARMDLFDRAQDRFAVLNGLERNAPLKTGERYKLVAE